MARHPCSAVSVWYARAKRLVFRLWASWFSHLAHWVLKLSCSGVVNVWVSPCPLTVWRVGKHARQRDLMVRGPTARNRISSVLALNPTP